MICFDAGTHNAQNDSRIQNIGISPDGKVEGQLTVTSGQTIYLAGGAVLQARLNFTGASNVSLLGRGVVDMSTWNSPDGSPDNIWLISMIELANSSNITIDGVTLKQPTGYSIAGGEVSNVTIHNIKSFSSQEYADGIDMMSSSDITIDGAFIRNSDDNIAIYGSRFSFTGDSRRWVVKNSTLWADKAHNIFIGVHGNVSANGDTLDSLSFQNIDILENLEQSSEYWGAMSIGAGDSNTVSNITFDTIRVDHILDSGGRLIDVQYKTYGTGVYGKSINNLVFRNIIYNGSKGSLFNGLNSNQTISEVKFVNFMLNSKRVCNIAAGNITTNSFVSSPQFFGPNDTACGP